MSAQSMPQPRSIAKRDVPASVARSVLASTISCHYCADVLMPRQVEHVRPLSRGGDNDRSNLAAACISCNTQKRAMLVHEWRQWREANGMSWPPVASHATALRHYGDRCRECCHSAPREGSWPAHQWITTPYLLELRTTGRPRYRAYYRCPLGDTWTCGFAVDTCYFSDCPCSWCVAKRAENGDETWPAAPRYDLLTPAISRG